MSNNDMIYKEKDSILVSWYQVNPFVIILIAIFFFYNYLSDYSWIQPKTSDPYTPKYHVYQIIFLHNNNIPFTKQTIPSMEKSAYKTDKYFCSSFSADLSRAKIQIKIRENWTETFINPQDFTLNLNPQKFG